MSDQIRILVLAEDVSPANSLCSELARLDFDTRACRLSNLVETLKSHKPLLVISTLSLDESLLDDRLHLAIGNHDVDKDVPRLKANAHPLQIASRIHTMIRLSVVSQIAQIRRRDAQSCGVSFTKSNRANDSQSVLFVGPASPVYMRLSYAMNRADIETVATFTSFSAFDFLHERQFDAVILNAKSDPELAYTVCSAMRRNTRLYHTPAIIISSASNGATAEEAFARGATDLLDFNADDDELRQRITSLKAERSVRRHSKFDLEACRDPQILSGLTDLYADKFGRKHVASLMTAHNSTQRALTLIGIRTIAPHDVGEHRQDHAYNQFASMLRYCVRVEDLAVRYDRDKFYLALPNTSEAAARNISDRIAAISHCTAYESDDPRVPFSLELETRHISCSDAMSADQYIEAALTPIGSANSLSAVV